MPERSSVAYVLKGWPRISELFIASEIYRLEQAGLPLRLYVIKAPDESQTHPVVDRITAPTEYLPPATSLSETTLLAWLRENLPSFMPALRGTARRHPTGLVRACALAAAQSIRARKGRSPGRASSTSRSCCRPSRSPTASRTRPTCAICTPTSPTARRRSTWLCSTITGLPFSFTGHAKDIYSPSLNPAGLLRRKLLAARFAVTCTEANVRHLKTIAPEAVVHRVYHGLNADFSRLMGEERAAAAPGPNGSTNGGVVTPFACSGSGASWRRRASTWSSTPAASSIAAACPSRPSSSARTTMPGRSCARASPSSASRTASGSRAR